MRGGFPNDPRAPVFFLSYARAQPARSIGPPDDANRHVHRLFADLTTNVNQLVSLSPGQDPGFMDTSMEGGQRWERRLLRAAGTCQVFICLLSHPYLHRSVWCPMEWDVFARRRVLRRSDGRPSEETNILPVLWAPVGDDIPAVVSEINWFSPVGLPDPDFAPRYQSDGILGLLTMGLEKVYQAVVWKLSLQVQQMFNTQYVRQWVPNGTDGLRRSFEKGA